MSLDWLTMADTMRNTATEESDITTPKPHTSFSQVETYNRCSLQWYFRYVLGQISPPTLPLARGKAGHAALEYNARKKIATGTDAPLDEILDTFSDAYDTQTADIVLKKDESIGATKDLTAESIRKFRTEVAPSRIPLKVEHSFDLDIPASEAYEHPIKIVKGYIDIIEVDPLTGLPAKGQKPSLAINDYKFVGRYPKTQDDADLSWQLTLYDYAVTRETGNPPTSLGFINIQEPLITKPARITPVTRSPEQMTADARAKRHERLIHVMRTTQRAMDAGIFMPTDNPKTCSWCGYRLTCQSSLAKDDWRSIQQKGA